MCIRDSSRSAGRIAAVREAVGIAAYVAEDYELALRELRTHRRISGSVDHLALLVDCERALGRLPKAQEMIAEFKREELPAEVRVELAIVESGILTDQGKKSQAVVALQIPQLNPKRAFEYSPRLFSAYADALANAGRDQEAERWARLSVVAEAALGPVSYTHLDVYKRQQIERFLSFEGENAARMVNNLDWSGQMSALQLLRDVGKHFRVGTMVKKEIVAKRLNSDEGISYTEFSYQILQGLDFLELNRRFGCTCLLYTSRCV